MLRSKKFYLDACVAFYEDNIAYVTLTMADKLHK